MERRLRAVYTDGVLRPLEAVELEEMQRVTVIIDDAFGAGDGVAGYFSPEEWAEAAHDEVGRDEVRQALSSLSGSLSDAIITLRQER